MIITSAQNPKIQRARKILTQKKTRDELGRFIIEGARLIEEAIRQGAAVETIFFTSPTSARTDEILGNADTLGIEILETTPLLLNNISDTQTAQGIVAIVHKRALPIPKELTFVLLLDEIRDPGNMGTIIRTAAAAGVDCILLSPGCTDPNAPKVVRATMGAQFSLPVYEFSWAEIRTFFANRPDMEIIASSLGESTDLWQTDLTRPLALVIGSEALGIGPESNALAYRKVHIPMTDRVESINAAVAAGILMYEVRRQRSR